MTCPTDSQLTDLLSDALADADSRTLRAHLEICRVCQARLDRLTDTPRLTRKPQSTAEVAVDGLDPLLQRLKQIPEQTPRMAPTLPSDPAPRKSPLPVVAIVGLMLLGTGAGWWTGWPTIVTSKNGTESAKSETQIAIDRLYSTTLAEVDLRQPEQVKQRRDTLDKLLSHYRSELAGLTSPNARSAEVAFRLAVLSAALEPPGAAINQLQRAIAFNSTFASNDSTERVQLCHEHLARLYRQTEQWPQADEHLRQQIDYWLTKWEARPTDLKKCRSVVALNRQLAEVRQKAGNWAGAEEAYQSAFNVLNMAAKSAPDSPFLQQELALVQRELDSAKSRSANPGASR